MGNYTREELEEALRAISSAIRKIEKVQEKPTLGKLSNLVHSEPPVRSK